MKTQIRRGIFETNSSSEHSLTVMPHDKFLDWKLGKLLARVKFNNEADNCWGNFWSKMKVLEFTDNFEQAEEDNKKFLFNYKTKNLKELEEWKEKCLNHKKLIDRKLTQEEIEKLSEKEYNEYEDKLYEDECYKFDQEEYNYWLERYNEIHLDNMIEEIGVVSGIWFTYDQFIEDLKIDCQSPFEHTDIDDNIHIIGKYFHS